MIRENNINVFYFSTLRTNVGTSLKTTAFFVKKTKFTQSSIGDLFCRATQPGSPTLERSVNIQIRCEYGKRGYSLKAFLDEMTLEVNIDLKMLAMCSIVSKGVDT